MSRSKGIKPSQMNPGFFETLVRDAIVGIIAFNAGTRACVYSNILAREILDLPRGSDLDAPPAIMLDDLYPREARGQLRPFSEDIMRRDGLTQDVLVKKQNGHTFIANIGVRYILGSGSERIALVMFQDITFQKKLQRELTAKQDEIRTAYTELLEQNRQLRELDQAKDRFVALMTHELRTPLSAIVATAEVLHLKLHESPEQMDEFIKSIHEQGLHLMELVNDVLDFAKIRAGKMEFYVERKDIRPVVVKALENFKSMAEQAHVEMSLVMPEQEIECYFDLVRMKEVLSNVISNAIKYNSRENGKVRVTIGSIESAARITVADTGQGIAPERLMHVFNEFETVGNVARHHKGTGLGMPISKRLIEGMGGRLSLNSEVGVGTEFYIDIPTEKVLPQELYRARPDTWEDQAA